jgi:hypothetical protein
MKTKHIIFLVLVVLASLSGVIFLMKSKDNPASNKRRQETATPHKSPNHPSLKSAKTRENQTPAPRRTLDLREIEDIDLRKLKFEKNFLNGDQSELIFRARFNRGDSFSSWANAASDLFLINHHAGGRWKIHDKEGNTVCDLPNDLEIDGKRYMLGYWLWYNNKCLVGVMYHDIYPNDDYDEADDSRLFLFQINAKEKTGNLLEIETPKVKLNHVVRIDAITPEGYLVLSDVSTSEYYPSGKFVYEEMDYETNEKFLGVFEVYEK